jgi:1,4-dihydroxy-2-naphthoate octaprenyltransferase
MKSKSFFNGVSKPMKLVFTGFVIALAGVILGLAMGSNYEPANPMAYLAFGTVCLGIVMGFVAIVWGWVSVMRQ